MTIKDKAFAKGVGLARKGFPLERALDRCPYQSRLLRSEFIHGWKSVSDKEEPET